MKCVFCGYDMKTDADIGECSGCSITRCHLKRCPKCGYEILPEPKSLKFIKRWLKKK